MDEVKAAAERRSTYIRLGFGDESDYITTGQAAEDALTLADAYLREHPADEELPIDEAWLRSVGFVDTPSFGMALTFRKEYGEDVATFTLSCCDAPNVGDGACWEIAVKSIELDPESAMLPCEPATRGQLRTLCRTLEIALEETGS